MLVSTSYSAYWSRDLVIYETAQNLMLDFYQFSVLSRSNASNVQWLPENELDSC